MKKLLARPVLLLALLLGLSAGFWSCKTETATAKDDREHTEKYKAIDDTIILGYLHRHNIVNYTRTNSGLYIITAAEGSGPTIKTGKSFSVKYIGYLLGYAADGTIFDTSYDNRSACQCATFVNGQQIAGWNEAVQTMQAGSRKTLLIPSYLAYGRYGSGTIPGDQPLRFDMEILAVAP